MASTLFVDDNTVIYASWLNDVNTATYTTIPAIQTHLNGIDVSISTINGSITDIFSALNIINANGWVTNARVTDVAWNKITGTPTTVSGYGIVDAFSTGNLETSASDPTYSSNNATKAATTQWVKAAQLGSTLQSWTDVTASRASGTVYTNNTNRPIEVLVTLSTVGTSGTSVIYVNGLAVATPTWSGVTTGNFPMTCSVTVPSGSTYKVDDGGATINKWCELR